jgi:hypothetical protein
MRSREQPRRRALVLLSTAAVVFVTAELFNSGGPAVLLGSLESDASQLAWFWTRFIVSGVLVPAGCCAVVAFLHPRRRIALWTGREVLELGGALVLAWLSIRMLHGFHGMNYLVPQWFDRTYSAVLLLWIVAFPAALIVVVGRWLMSRAGVRPDPTGA